MKQEDSIVRLGISALQGGEDVKDLHDVEANGTKEDGDLIHWSAANNRWEPTDRLTSLELRVAALEGP